MFIYPITVNHSHIDSLNHVNNEVYLKWLIEAASAHSDSLGFTMEKFLSMNQCFVVRRHEIDYLAPAFLEQELEVQTWIEDIKGSRSIRSYQIVRKKDGALLMRAQTVWVYISLETGKPLQIPEHVHSIFEAAKRI